MTKYDTSNPEWFKAKKAEDIIAKPPNSIMGKLLLDKVGQFYLTQGPLAGQRFKDNMLPWQERLIRWFPHVEEIAIKMGKGSGKSVWVAALALAVANTWIEEKSHARGLIAILSANVESARIVFSHAVESILFDWDIREFWKPNAQSRSIVHRATGITIQILPPKLNRAIGLRPALLILDELHEAATVSEFDTVLRQLVHGGKNWESFKMVTITTAPPGDPAPAYSDWLIKARAARDAKPRNPKLLPALFEFPVLQRPELDHDKAKNWFFGMPSLIRRKNGKGTMLASVLREELKAAEADIETSGLEDYQSLLSQRLGIEAEERTSGATMLAKLWPDLKIKPIDGQPERVFIGLDPSPGLADPFAVTILKEYGDLWVVDSRQYLTPAGLENISNKLKGVYNRAIKREELFICDTDTDIESLVFELCREYWGADVYYGGDAAGLSGFVQRFEGIIGSYTPVMQGWRLIAAFESAQGAAYAGRLKHYGNSLLSFNVRNIRIKNNKFEKADIFAGGSHGFSKIDAAMAMFSAIFMLGDLPKVNIESMIG